MIERDSPSSHPSYPAQKHKHNSANSNPSNYSSTKTQKHNSSSSLPSVPAAPQVANSTHSDYSQNSPDLSYFRLSARTHRPYRWTRARLSCDLVRTNVRRDRIGCVGGRLSGWRRCRLCRCFRVGRDGARRRCRRGRDDRIRCCTSRRRR